MNRVDKLIKEYSDLSLEERGEFLGRTGLSGGSVTARVMSLEDLTNEALNSEFLQEPSTEFFFYYQRPEWVSKIKEGLEFQFKMLFENVFHIEIGYEPEKLIELLKAFYTLEFFRITSKPSDSLLLDFHTQEKYEYFDDQNRVSYSRLARWSFNGEEIFQNILAASQYVREEICISETWKELFEENDKGIEDVIQSIYLIGLPSHLKLALDRLLNEIITLVTNQDTEVTNKQYQLLSKMPTVFVRPRAAHRPRNARTEPKTNSNEFVERVKMRHPLAQLMVKAYNKREDDNWRQMLEVSSKFKQLSEGCDNNILDEIFTLILKRIENKSYPLSPNTYNKIKSPLAFACEIAARELSINCDNPLRLIGMFEDAGGRIKARKIAQ